MDSAIIPECYIDTNLIETIVPPQNRYNHQKGCGTVTTVMQQNFSDRFAVGIIDKDKKKVEYLKYFTKVTESPSLILHKHKDKHHYIIEIYPAIERFILTAVDVAELQLTDFNLPFDFDKFKKTTKTVNSKDDLRFKQLFKALLKKNVPEIEKLGKWIAYLKDNNYNVDIEVLKGI